MQSYRLLFLLVACLCCAALAVAQQSPTPVSLMWDPAPATRGVNILRGYRVTRQAEDGKADVVVCTTAPTVRHCDDVLTVPGRYSYTVAGDYGIQGMSDASNTVIVVLQPPLRSPQQLRGTARDPAPPGPYPMWPRDRLRVQAVDSEEVTGENGQAIHIIDGTVSTFWHTQWTPPISLMPHWIILDLQTIAWIDGLEYVPRQDAGMNGIITDYGCETSIDGAIWISGVAAGKWSGDATPKGARWGAVEGRYVRLTVTASVGARPYASAAELRIFAVPRP